MNFILNEDTLDEDEYYVADINQDGNINIVDVDLTVNEDVIKFAKVAHRFIKKLEYIAITLLNNQNGPWPIFF